MEAAAARWQSGFHAVVTVVPGEFKQAQAGVVGLFVKDLGSQHPMEDGTGSGTDELEGNTVLVTVLTQDDVVVFLHFAEGDALQGVRTQRQRTQQVLFLLVKNIAATVVFAFKIRKNLAINPRS